MTPIELMYKEYRDIRNSDNARHMSARQAFLWARGRIVQRCRNQLLHKDDPRRPENVRDAADLTTTHHFMINGHDCTLEIEDDPDIAYDFLGFSVSRNRAPYREHGWGHDGMDRGVYVVDDDTLVTFDETRQDILPYAPKGMSKQVAYEWATDMMQSRLESYKSRMSDDLRSYYVRLECEELSIIEALGGVEIDVTDPESEKYLEDVVDELYSQFIYEFDRLKKIA